MTTRKLTYDDKVRQQEVLLPAENLWKHTDANEVKEVVNEHADQIDELYARTVSVRDFGAKGDGVTDDTAAINAAIGYLEPLSSKRLYFPSGQYKVTARLTPLVSNNWQVSGDGIFSTIIQPTMNDILFTSDPVPFVGTTGNNRHEYSNFTIQWPTSGAYDQTVGILINGDPAITKGLQYGMFRNIRFFGCYRCIRILETGKYISGPFLNNVRHGFFTFDNIVIPFSNNPIYEGIVWEGGSGPHHIIKGGQLRGTNAAIRIGSPGHNGGVGDITIAGTHIVIAGVGIDVYGPIDSNVYNQNITISGGQFDNCSIATVRMDKMKNFRIIPNNSTTSVGLSLTNCSNYIIEDRNSVTMQGLTLERANQWNGRPLIMGNYHLWIDATGKLRIKDGAPTSDTDGTIVGTQS